MRKWIIGLMLALIVTSGMAFPMHCGTIAEIPRVEMTVVEYLEMPDFIIPNHYQVNAPVEIGFLEEGSSKLTSAKGGVSWVNESTLKVAIYSVPLREENKIVLVKDPKGFVERAIRHGMEYLAIKPMDKGDEYWETVPVFSIEKDLSLKPKTTTEIVPEDSDLLRLIPVADFLRYN